MAQKIHRCTLEVRGYELDSYGHVNHAVYFNYLEQARWKMLTDEKITFEKMELWKRWPVIGGVEAKYLKPTFMGDVLEIESQAQEVGRASVKITQRITRNGEDVLTAKISIVIVNELGRPAEMPAEMLSIWQ